MNELLPGEIFVHGLDRMPTQHLRKRLLVSFSGGETSAMMTLLLKTKWRSRFDEMLVLFANTGQENEETLDFVDRCDKAFKLGVVWLEAVPQPGRKGTAHKVVSMEYASRNGQPFEACIQKYGIPNNKFPWCTRELKLRPIYSYLEDYGWRRNTYNVAIGIRADEPRRRAKNAEKDGIVYPFLDWEPTTKKQVNTFWRDQLFRLDLAGYQGNCKTCWKKSTRKLLTVMDDDPSNFDFFERMEEEHGTTGPEFKKTTAEGYRRTFFRNNVSVRDLRLMYALDDWQRAENDAIIYLDKQVQLDVDSADGCVESCEIDFSM